MNGQRNLHGFHRILFASIVLCLSTGARASTIWYPNDGNVNTLNVSILFNNTTNGILSFGIFAPSNTSLVATPGHWNVIRNTSASLQPNNTSLVATPGNYLPVSASADTARSNPKCNNFRG